MSGLACTLAALAIITPTSNEQNRPWNARSKYVRLARVELFTTRKIDLIPGEFNHTLSRVRLNPLSWNPLNSMIFEISTPIVDDEENVKIGGNEAGHDFSLASKRVKIKH